MTDVLPEMLPDGTAVQRAHSPLMLVLALTGALLLGAGLAVVIYALVDDEPVITSSPPAVVKSLDNGGRVAVTPANPVQPVRIDKRLAAPTGSLAGTTSQTARDEAKVHAATVQRLGQRNTVGGTPADGTAAVAAGTAAKDEAAVAAAIGNSSP
jgi:hypothetical protein